MTPVQPGPPQRTETRDHVGRALIALGCLAALGFVAVVATSGYLGYRARKRALAECDRADAAARSDAGSLQAPHVEDDRNMSCEAARKAYQHRQRGKAPPRVSAGQYGAVLNTGTYLDVCDVPATMGVTVCAAVQDGRAVGVTVTTESTDGAIAACIAEQVRAMTFPRHPLLDVTTTRFKPH